MEVRHDIIPVALRGDFGMACAARSCEEDEVRPAGAAASDAGGHLRRATRAEAAKIGGVTLQIIRDWVMRFNARGLPACLMGKSPGQPGGSMMCNARRLVRDGRERSDPGDPRCSALAADRSCAMDLRGVPASRSPNRR